MVSYSPRKETRITEIGLQLFNAGLKMQHHGAVFNKTEVLHTFMIYV